MIAGLALAEMSRPWRPFFGDNSPIGWTITVSYFVATACCYAAYRRELAVEGAAPAGRQPKLWLALTIAMLLLGLNKQLDLQILIPSIGRQIFMHAGLYGRRRSFQLVFIAVVAAIALFAVVKAYAYTRRVGARYRFAMLGVLYLAAFVTVRAASFHHIDIILGTRLENVKVNTFLELGGTLSVALGALLAIWKERDLKVAGP